MRFAMNRRGRGALLAMAGVLTLVGVAGAVSLGYTFQPVDILGPGSNTSVFGITPSGVMTGNYARADGQIAGFIERKGELTSVTVPDSVYTELVHINNQGTAVGNYIDADGLGHGFTYSPRGAITPLPAPVPGAFTGALGINNKGAVVGFYSLDGFATVHGYRYEGGKFTPIDIPDALYIYPWAITNSGTVGGWFVDGAGYPHGFLADRDGHATPFDVPGALATFIYGLNERGDIVGSYYDATVTRHGFLSRAGAITTIDFPGAVDSDVFDINDPGVIVGSYDGYSRGFVAYPSP